MSGKSIPRPSHAAVKHHGSLSSIDISDVRLNHKQARRARTSAAFLVAPNDAHGAASSTGYVLLHAIVACLTAVRPAWGSPTGLDHHARRSAPDPTLVYL